MRTMWDDYSHNLRYEKDFEHIIADVLKGQIDNSGIPSITDEDPTMEGKTCFEVTTRAAQWGNQISSEAKEKIAKKIQESLMDENLKKLQESKADLLVAQPSVF